MGGLSAKLHQAVFYFYFYWGWSCVNLFHLLKHMIGFILELSKNGSEKPKLTTVSFYPLPIQQYKEFIIGR